MATLSIPFSLTMLARISPWRASDGAVRKKKPSSSMSVSAGEVADGETMTTPFGIATLLAMAVVTPEQSAPMIAATFSPVIRLVAAVVAAAASMQVESARTGFSVRPSGSLPESEASLKASSAEAAMPGVIDSSGPVKPRMMPTLAASCAAAAEASTALAAVASRIRFMEVSLYSPVFSARAGPATPRGRDRIT